MSTDRKRTGENTSYASKEQGEPLWSTMIVFPCHIFEILKSYTNGYGTLLNDLSGPEEYFLHQMIIK